MYQLALIIVYVLMFLGVLEVWPAILHFHHADFQLPLLWEVPIRVGVMPFLIGALLSFVCRPKGHLSMIAFAVAPATTLLVNGFLLEARFDWREIVIWIVGGTCAVAGAWTTISLPGKSNTPTQAHQP